MDQAHIDIVLTTSKHNVQYLLGGHRTFFFPQSRPIVAEVAARGNHVD
jgi:hypothetical protein